MKCKMVDCKAFDSTETNNCANLYDITECGVRFSTQTEEVCEFTLCHKTNSDVKIYETSCGLDYESPDSQSKYCRGCGKPIKIRR